MRKTNEEFESVWHDVDLNLFSLERVQLTGLRSAGRRSSKPKQSIKTVPRDPITRVAKSLPLIVLASEIVYN